MYSYYIPWIQEDEQDNYFLLFDALLSIILSAVYLEIVGWRFLIARSYR